MSDPRPAEMEIEGPKRSIWRNLSLTWLIPIAALAITLLIAWQSWAERGARIEITFDVYGHLMKDRDEAHRRTAEELADELLLD